jgi:hypothetical protein
MVGDLQPRRPGPLETLKVSFSTEHTRYPHAEGDDCQLGKPIQRAWAQFTADQHDAALSLCSIRAI